MGRGWRTGERPDRPRHRGRAGRGPWAELVERDWLSQIDLPGAREERKAPLPPRSRPPLGRVADAMGWVDRRGAEGRDGLSQVRWAAP